MDTAKKMRMDGMEETEIEKEKEMEIPYSA